MNQFNFGWQLLRSLGPRWLLFRARYALRQESGWEAWHRPISSWDAMPLAAWLKNRALAEPTAYHEFRLRSATRFFFDFRQLAECEPLFAAWDVDTKETAQTAERIKRGEFPLFGNARVQCGRLPDWHRNPFTGQRAPDKGHWSRLNEFAFGDIKLVWELNRFGFVFPLVRAYWRTGDESLAECFWKLVEDWRLHNPPQMGINWKCGQEASFRVMAWCFGLYGFAGAAASSPERVTRLAQMLAATGQRIESNLGYALSQRNNHGVSEATGLWTLGILFPEFCRAANWRKIGEKALEWQARELIYDDGGFTQHSVNYHRVMLESYLWSIQLGRFNGSSLSDELVFQVRKAGNFLASLMDRETGRVPNWGSNDGAHVLPLSNCSILDYRPVVQTAAVITGGKPAVSHGPWDEEASWLGVTCSEKISSDTVTASARRDFPDSGLTVVRNGIAKVVLRTTRPFRHRPAQCDLLHLDLWLRGRNILPDSGSYSYNSPNGLGEYFKSVAAHNTIQFDGHDQMPVLGRFLYGSWPQGDVSLPVDHSRMVISSYVDWKGCRHERTMKLESGCCQVTDRISGFKDHAVLRWHLSADVDWTVTGSACVSRLAAIRVTADGKMKSVRLAEGWESLFYNFKTHLPVFELTVASGCELVQSEIVFD